MPDLLCMNNLAHDSLTKERNNDDVDLDYVKLSKAGSMVMLVASGTAVIIEED